MCLWWAQMHDLIKSAKEVGQATEEVNNCVSCSAARVKNVQKQSAVTSRTALDAVYWFVGSSSP